MNFDLFWVNHKNPKSILIGERKYGPDKNENNKKNLINLFYAVDIYHIIYYDSL